MGGLGVVDNVESDVVSIRSLYLEADGSLEHLDGTSFDALISCSQMPFINWTDGMCNPQHLLSALCVCLSAH